MLALAGSAKAAGVQEDYAACGLFRRLEECGGGVDEIGALVLDDAAAEVGRVGGDGLDGVGKSGAERGHPGNLPAARQQAARVGLPDAQQEEVLALVEIGVAAVAVAVELLGEGGAQSGGEEELLTAVKSRSKKSRDERVALIVDGVAPRVGGLGLDRAGPVADQGRERIVIGSALAGAPGDIGEIFVGTAGAGCGGELAIHEVGGDEPPSQEPVPFTSTLRFSLNGVLHAEEEGLRVAVAQLRVDQGEAGEIRQARLGGIRAEDGSYGLQVVGGRAGDNVDRAGCAVVARRSARGCRTAGRRTCRSLRGGPSCLFRAGRRRSRSAAPSRRCRRRRSAGCRCLERRRMRGGAVKFSPGPSVDQGVLWWLRCCWGAP